MLQALIGPATNLIGKFVEDKDQKNKLAHEIATMAERHAQDLAKVSLKSIRWRRSTGLYLWRVGAHFLAGA